MKFISTLWQRVKRFTRRYTVGILLLPVIMTGCARPVCEDPSASSTPAIRLGELRSDVLCQGGTVRVSIAVEGGHFYTMLGDFIGSPLGNNMVTGRMFGPPVSPDIEFQFGNLDELSGTLIRSFFARTTGNVTIELTNESRLFVQGVEETVTLFGDFTIVETRFQMVDSGVEDHGELPENATHLLANNNTTFGTLPTGDKLDYFRLPVEAGRSYRVIFETTKDLRFGTARVDRFGQFTELVPTDNGTDFDIRAKRGIVETQDFTVRITEDALLAVSIPPIDPVDLLLLLGQENTLDGFPIEYAITISELGPDALGSACNIVVPAPTIDWAQILKRSEGVFDLTCRENTIDDIFLKYVQQDPDVTVDITSSGDRFMVLTNMLGFQEIFIPGTDIQNLNDLQININTNLVFENELGASFHAGIIERAKIFRSEIERLLNPELPIRVAGFSLGGAVAVIFSLYLDLDGFEVDSVLTFGQFPLTDEGGVRKFANHPLLRIKSGLDGIPDLFIEQFNHFGDMIILLDGPLFVYLDSDNANFVSATSDLRAFDPFVDHTTYLDRLQGKKLSPAQVSFCDAKAFLADGVNRECP